ncbi:MAG: hypothetical protein HFG69_07300 [Hungatella sp.]|nr:hypothetical protein [Hungatella sp.]
MKKLYENIEDIHIKGGVGQLSEVVKAMDMSLQNIADNTEQLTGYLAKYSSSNKGAQYEKLVNTSFRLRDKMFQASIELNEMQNQIVAYQNKIYRYEDMSENAAPPNPYLVTKRQVNVDTSVVQFNRSDMIDLAATLRDYSDRVFHHIRTINRKKNSIAGVWMDTQYDDFEEFIDNVTKNIVEAIKIYEEYVIYLEDKIKELG